MAWEDTLLPGSFRGVEFEVQSINDTFGRAVVVKEYPYRNGAHTQDLGANMRPMRFEVVVYGDDYEQKLHKLLHVLVVEGGYDELVHPIFGPLKAQVSFCDVRHEWERPNYAALTVEFKEHGLDTPIFNRVLPEQNMDAVDEDIDDVLEAADEEFTVDLEEIEALGEPSLSSFVGDLLDGLAALAEIIGEWLPWLELVATWLPEDDTPGALTGSNNPYLNQPGSYSRAISARYIDAIRAAYRPTGQQRFYQHTTLAKSWQATYTALGKPLLPGANIVPTAVTGPIVARPNRTSQPVVQPCLLAHCAIQQSCALASAAVTLYQAVATTRNMTPNDIETISNDVRGSINRTIAIIKTTYPDLVRQRPLTEPLKALALRIIEIADQLIRARPPLIDRQVGSTANLSLLAHFWYGDHKRADELRVLNPHIINPNFIVTGTVVRGYEK